MPHRRVLPCDQLPIHHHMRLQVSSLHSPLAQPAPECILKVSTYAVTFGVREQLLLVCCCLPARLQAQCHRLKQCSILLISSCHITVAARDKEHSTLLTMQVAYP